MAKYCPNCNIEVESGKFCPECGSKLEDLPTELYCPSCGKVYDHGKFCPDCGVELEERSKTIGNSTQVVDSLKGPSTIECPACGFQNALGAKECDNCGFPLLNVKYTETPSENDFLLKLENDVDVILCLDDDDIPHMIEELTRIAEKGSARAASQLGDLFSCRLDNDAEAIKYYIFAASQDDDNAKERLRFLADWDDLEADAKELLDDYFKKQPGVLSGK